MEAHKEAHISVRRLAGVLEVPVATVGRWIKAPCAGVSRRARVAPKDEDLAGKIGTLCLAPRNKTFGHRRVRALLKREYGLTVNRKRVLRVMRKLGLTQLRIRHKEARPKRVEKMRPWPNQAWQIDMTSFQLSDLSPCVSCGDHRLLQQAGSWVEPRPQVPGVGMGGCGEDGA